MKTNCQMLKSLLGKFDPKEFGIVSAEEANLVETELCLKDMDILALRNLRDTTVLLISREPYNRKLWDKMSAITYMIDAQIVKLGGEV